MRLIPSTTLLALLICTTAMAANHTRGYQSQTAAVSDLRNHMRQKGFTLALRAAVEKALPQSQVRKLRRIPLSWSEKSKRVLVKAPGERFSYLDDSFGHTAVWSARRSKGGTIHEMAAGSNNDILTARIRGRQATFSQERIHSSKEAGYSDVHVVEKAEVTQLSAGRLKVAYSVKTTRVDQTQLDLNTAGFQNGKASFVLNLNTDDSNMTVPGTLREFWRYKADQEGSGKLVGAVILDAGKRQVANNTESFAARFSGGGWANLQVDYEKTTPTP